MILNALVPCQLAKFGDIARYFLNGARQVDTVWDLAPRTDEIITVGADRTEVPWTNVTEVIRPVTIYAGQTWITQNGKQARILETAAPGLYPIVGLIINNGVSTPMQFSWCGLSSNASMQLQRPKAMEDELECLTPASSTQSELTS